MKNNIFLLAIALFVSSCIDNISTGPSTSGQSETVKTRGLQDDGLIHYERIQNPYSLSNMIATLGDHGLDTNISPTDFYVCFKIQSQDQYSTLVDSCGLELFEFPLDIVLHEGESYVNIEKPDTDLAWLYTIVPTTFDFPSGIPFQILTECYYPSEDFLISDSDLPSMSLEFAAHERLGYVSYSDLINSSTNGAHANSRPPRGYIQIETNAASALAPVKGIKVTCSSLFKWETVYTDSNGYYEMSTNFFLPPMYSVSFENSRDFSIATTQKILFTHHYVLGWYSNRGHNYSVDFDTDDLLWQTCAINNAAYDYYDVCEDLQILPPPSDLHIWTTNLLGKTGAAPMLYQLKDEQFYFDRWGDITNFAVNFFIMIPVYILRDLLSISFPDILISTTNRTYESLYAVTFHELTHSSHFQQVGPTFWRKYIEHIMDNGTENMPYGIGTEQNASYCAIGESWAYAMESMLCQDRLRPSSTYYYHTNSPSEAWIPANLFIDLVNNNISRTDLFHILTLDITLFDLLKEKLLDNFPNFANIIENAFTNNQVALQYDWPLQYDITLNGETTCNSTYSDEYILLDGFTIHHNTFINVTGELTILPEFCIDSGVSFSVNQ